MRGVGVGGGRGRGVWIHLLLLCHIYTLPVTDKISSFKTTYIVYELTSFKTIICTWGGWWYGVVGVGGGWGSRGG